MFNSGAPFLYVSLFSWLMCEKWTCLHNCRAELKLINVTTAEILLKRKSLTYSYIMSPFSTVHGASDKRKIVQWIFQ